MSGDIQHVVGYGWTDGTPMLHLFDAPSRRLEGSISLRLTGQRRCTGWWDRATGVRRACQSALPPTKPQCIECSRREGFWQCMTCDGFQCPALSPEIHDYCRAEHVLYLACFGSERVKIGTSIATRREKRLVEQGPVSAMHIAQAPGPIIKQMEALGVKLGLSEHMSRKQKWDAWRHRIDMENIRSKLEAAHQMYVSELPEHYHVHLHSPLILRLPASVASTALLSKATLTRLEAGLTVRGRVEAGRGHIALIHDGAGHIALDLAALKGQVVDFAPVGGKPPVRQLGLFE